MKSRIRSVTSWKRIAAAVALAVVSSAPAQAFTLVVAPARYSVLQFAFDLLSRTPAVLISYQGDATSGEPRLHAWNGTEWVALSMKDYREVNFLEQLPSETILIGSDTVLPASLIEASAWAPHISRAYDLTTGALVNDFGRILKWRESEWKWFAKRYNLRLEDESMQRRNSSWYDQPGPLPDRPRFFKNIGRPVVTPAVEMPPAGTIEADPIPPALIEDVVPVTEEPALIDEPAPAGDAAAVEEPASVEEPLMIEPEPIPLSDEGVGTETDAALSVFSTPSP